jgi:glutathione synthase/RimK-type ligase-like ATP-grasp enzyme
MTTRLKRVYIHGRRREPLTLMMRNSMPEPEARPLNIVCLATYFKGDEFIRECKAHGCQVTLITKEKMLSEDWPRDSLDDLIALPNDAGPSLFIDLVAYLSRKAKPDRVIALEEFDVITAALIREHFCLPGLSSSRAKVFRDKMAMAVYSSRAGINVPEFVALINPDEVREFMERVPGPWVIKPRSDVSAIGIRKVETPQEVWATIDELNARENLRERASYYLLARFIPGQVFHVDSVVNNGRVLFAGVNQYGRPPLQVAHHGGAYISHTVARGSADEKRLLEKNRKLIKALRLEKGTTHAEFIKNSGDENFYFLEVAARVGGAYIANVLEAASGINLWREWARIEISEKPEENGVQALRKEYAGIILSLAKQESPDTSAYTDSEIVYRVKKRHHAGMIVRSPRLERVVELLDDYGRRFAEDFVAVVPPPERPE